jgi:hypothetical protein
MNKFLTVSFMILTLSVFGVQPTGAQSAKALVEQAAQAMGGMAALRAVNNEVVEAEGKQFDAVFPLQAKVARQITSLRYTLSRELGQPRMRLEWGARHLGRNIDVQFVEIIDGGAGLLQEGTGASAKSGPLHPDRMAIRSKATPAICCATAIGAKPVLY